MDHVRGIAAAGRLRQQQSPGGHPAGDLGRPPEVDSADQADVRGLLLAALPD